MLGLDAGCIRGLETAERSESAGVEVEGVWNPWVTVPAGAAAASIAFFFFFLFFDAAPTRGAAAAPRGTMEPGGRRSTAFPARPSPGVTPFVVFDSTMFPGILALWIVIFALPRYSNNLRDNFESFFPKVCYNIFSNLCFCITVRPERIQGGPNESRASLVGLTPDDGAFLVRPVTEGIGFEWKVELGWQNMCGVELTIGQKYRLFPAILFASTGTCCCNGRMRGRGRSEGM